MTPEGPVDRAVPDEPLGADERSASGATAASGAGASSAAGRRRTIVTSAALVVVLLGLAVYGLRWWTSHAYVGSTQRVVLTWDCGNGIFWVDPASGTKWWAGHDPTMAGRVETAPRQPGPIISVKTAAGSMHIDSSDTAVFTSDAGGTMPLTRQEPGTLYTADCSLDAGG